MVRIKLISYLSTMMKWREKEFYVISPTKVGDLISIPLPDDRIIILINEKGGNFDSLVDNGDEVKIFPVVGGG